MFAIEIENLVKKYPSVRTLGSLLRKNSTDTSTLALDDVSLTIKKGEVFGLLGPNGAGKTTLISILSTIVIPTSGAVRVGGLDIQKEAAEARKLIGLVTSNERSFYWRLTGRQNLQFFAELYRVPANEIKSRLQELLSTLDIESYAERRFDKYSTGIRQRFAVARALLHQPQILYMDEPTKGLDPNAAGNLLSLIKQRILGIWNPTIIITSHNLKDIEELCTRVAILNQGKIIGCGNIEELSCRVSTHETYQMLLDNVTDRCLDEIGGVTGVSSIRRLEDLNGHINIEVLIKGGGQTLSEILQKVFSSGGDVHYCSYRAISLTDIFEHLVSCSAET